MKSFITDGPIKSIMQYIHYGASVCTYPSLEGKFLLSETGLKLIETMPVFSVAGLNILNTVQTYFWDTTWYGRQPVYKEWS